jgi:hypothetical protein
VKVYARLDETAYPTKVNVTNAQMTAVDITGPLAPRMEISNHAHEPITLIQPQLFIRDPKMCGQRKRLLSPCVSGVPLTYALSRTK